MNIKSQSLILSIGLFNQQQQCKIFKASLGSKRILISYFIITEPTELKLS